MNLRFFDSNQLGFILGIVFFVVLLMVPAPAGLEGAAWKTAAVAALMATWWISEAIPIYATALLPIVLFPVLDIAVISDTTAPYANPLIFLFMGGFIIAIAMQKWNLHRRIALRIVHYVGVKPTSIIIGFIIASAFLSMWVSNTATALMMLPIAMSVLQIAEEDPDGSGAASGSGVANFQIALILAIAYACNIGGIGTLIGTPPNALLAAFMFETYSIEIGFAQWLLVGVPLMLIMLPVMFVVLTKFTYPIALKELPGGSGIIEAQLEKLGSVTKPEIRVAAVFVITALLWIFRPLLSGAVPGLSDAGIAIAAGVSLFIIPGGTDSGRRLITWSDLKELPWGILILFGGGLSLAMAISSSGLAAWIGEAVSGLEAIPLFLLLLSTIAIVVFLTEITSNTATAAAFLPILASSALGIGQNPMLFVIPAAVAASCAFMLPVATPPNAIVYGSGKVNIPDMAKAGLWLNIFVSFLLTIACYTLLGWVFGIEPNMVPDWAR
ncbi:SLC13 family permease [Rhodohalobacter mucosus]|uniref:Anion transporter n=1 Tax=Rhodohalobacter mucosus TaxID=2079485 RepID=A0A316U2D5_9BACT|nr:DASS family sodium-coupled anion symporter [Rhodohalobacter mucosus]PWN07356.1 anion transporter [Rhodohalobacter mucosus]